MSNNQVTDEPLPVDNPYTSPGVISPERIKAGGTFRQVAGSLSFLTGLAVFGIGMLAVFLTIDSVSRGASRDKWWVMVAVTCMYLTFGLMHFAAAQCFFRGRVRWGVVLFGLPIAIFLSLLGIFGV